MLCLGQMSAHGWFQKHTSTERWVQLIYMERVPRTCHEWMGTWGEEGRNTLPHSLRKWRLQTNGGPYHLGPRNPLLSWVIPRKGKKARVSPPFLLIRGSGLVPRGVDLQHSVCLCPAWGWGSQSGQQGSQPSPRQSQKNGSRVRKWWVTGTRQPTVTARKKWDSIWI